jgi:hypothetical protein
METPYEIVMVTLPGTLAGKVLHTSFERALSTPFASVTEILKYTVVFGVSPVVTVMGEPFRAEATLTSVPEVVD